jgi:hypothetical protein
MHVGMADTDGRQRNQFHLQEAQLLGIPRIWQQWTFVYVVLVELGGDSDMS